MHKLQQQCQNLPYDINLQGATMQVPYRKLRDLQKGK